jgi:hypothetical protein
MLMVFRLHRWLDTLLYAFLLALHCVLLPDAGKDEGPVGAEADVQEVQDGEAG